MNTSTWSSNTSSGYYIPYTATTTTGDGYGTYNIYYSYPVGNHHYNAIPAPVPVKTIEKETDLADVLSWMKRGANIGKMAEIMKMLEEEIQ